MEEDEDEEADEEDEDKKKEKKKKTKKNRNKEQEQAHEEEVKKQTQGKHKNSIGPVLGRRPTDRQKPKNPVAGHGARGIPGGLRLVPEGYRRCRPFKNLVFYGISGPSAATDFMSAMCKNRCFYVALGSSDGKKWEKLASCMGFNIDGQHNGRDSANIAPKMNQHGANIVLRQG